MSPVKKVTLAERAVIARREAEIHRRLAAEANQFADSLEAAAAEMEAGRDPYRKAGS